jgi:hypothetical protein
MFLLIFVSSFSRIAAHLAPAARLAALAAELGRAALTLGTHGVGRSRHTAVRITLGAAATHFASAQRIASTGALRLRLRLRLLRHKPLVKELGEGRGLRELLSRRALLVLLHHVIASCRVLRQCAHDWEAAQGHRSDRDRSARRNRRKDLSLTGFLPAFSRL